MVSSEVLVRTQAQGCGFMGDCRGGDGDVACAADCLLFVKYSIGMEYQTLFSLYSIIPRLMARVFAFNFKIPSLFLIFELTRTLRANIKLELKNQTHGLFFLKEKEIYPFLFWRLYKFYRITYYPGFYSSLSDIKWASGECFNISFQMGIIIVGEN